MRSQSSIYTLYDFDLTSTIICQNQCKLAKVRVSTHDFQCFHQTAYSAEQQAIITALENTTQTSKPTAISTDSLSTLLAASGNRWTRNPKTRNIRNDSGNHISLIWVPSHAGISGNKAADKAALTEEIDNRETYPPQGLIKWMRKEECMNRQKRWERGDNKTRNQKTSASWQNDTADLSKKNK
jgi:ribonuclease HI